jgi:hypothetical protein
MLVFSRRSQESVAVGGPADLERILEVTVLECATEGASWALRW